jgi:predicted nuclease of predicted toxin-antitoxin system
MIPANHPLLSLATPMVIVAPVRAGGTFLSHCLSNHPDIYCDRGEPLRQASGWRAFTRENRAELLTVLASQTGYRVSGFKLTYDQAFQDDVQAWLATTKPRVIWLRRENLLRQAISQIVNRAVREGALQRAQHSFGAVAIEPVAIEPADAIRYLVHFGRQNKAAEKLLAELTVLPVTYEEITANREHGYEAQELNPEAGARICEFLGVPYAPMPTRLVRIHAGPISSLVSNWQELRVALLDAGYAAVVAGERQWTSS